MTRLLHYSLALLMLSFAGATQAQVDLDAKAEGASDGDARSAASQPASAAPPPWREGLVAERRGYASRPIALRGGAVRLDLGPSDFAYMDSGEINSGRGVRVDASPDAADAFNVGVGMAFGLADCIEFGALILPIRMVPDPHYADAELYSRARITDWLAAQVAFQLPTETDFGVGIGFPLLFRLADSLRLDTGVEAELFTTGELRGNLDVPIALTMNLGERGFAGLRSGVLLSDFSDLAMSAGLQVGVLFEDLADITASVSLPRFVWTGAGDVFNGDVINVTLGLTVYIDARGDDDELPQQARRGAPR